MNSTSLSVELVSCLPRLWRYCLGLTQQRVSADDLAQATCLRALERHDQYRGDAPLDRWLIRIARNTWFNQLKAEQIRNRGDLVMVDQFGPDAFASSPEESAYKAQVFSAVMELPEAQREVVLLVYVEGWSYREAAETLDIPIGTIMSRLAAARRKLAAMKDSDPARTAGRGQEQDRHGSIGYQ